jgi:hypothetical protein
MLVISWNMVVNGSDTNYFDLWKLKDIGNAKKVCTQLHRLVIELI